MEAKRILSEILALTLATVVLLCNISVSVFATEVDYSETEILPAEEFETNGEIELVAGETSTDFIGDSMITVSVEYTNPLFMAFDYSQFISVDEAALIVRDNLRSHVNDFTVFIATNTPDYREAYMQLLYTAENHTGNPIEGDYLVWQTGDMQILINLLVNNGTYYYIMHFIVPYYTTIEQEAELDMVVNQILDSLNLYNASDYDKVKGIYDYLCQNVTYDYAHSGDASYTLKHSAYAALVQKNAVCQGYALAFYRLALSLGIDARIVGGTANGGAHDWNIVELGGRYFDLDATWDAGRTNYKYFLKSEEHFADHVRYDEYNTGRFVTRHPISSQDYYEAEFTVIDGTLISYNGVGGDVVIPEGVTEIGEGAFRNEANITSITVPTSVMTVSDNAFDCNASKIIFKSKDTFISNSFNTIGLNTVIRGYADSTAKAYADMFGRVFEEISNNDGDIDGNGIVDNNDAVYLLYASIFGTEEYPVSQDCDYNNNGIIDEQDATYLLYHTLFGAEEYPLN